MIIYPSSFEILAEYYSVPILEVITTENESRYMAIAIRDEKSPLPKYLVVSVSDDDYSRYTSRVIDLLELVSRSSEIYKCALNSNVDFIVTRKYDSILYVEDEYLPSPGFYHDMNL